MRNYKIIIIFLLSILCFNLNAQRFIGGSIRINTTNTNHDETTTPNKFSSYDLMLMPRVGRYLSDNLAVGLDLKLSFNGQKSDQNPATKSNSSEIGLSPFIRYYAIRLNKFSVYGEGYAGMSFTRSKSKTGGITTDGPKNTLIYLGVHPGLSYDISDKISLETSLNILSLDSNYAMSKNGSSNDKSLHFNFGAGLGNIISLNAITVGGIFKF